MTYTLVARGKMFATCHNGRVWMIGADMRHAVRETTFLDVYKSRYVKIEEWV